MIKNIFLMIIGFSSGVIIAGGVFAFIAIIGIVPRLAQKTKTEKYIKVYEDFILLGGLFGVITMLFPIRIMFGVVGLAIIGLAIGVFVGCLAVSIAEVLDVVPILTRRLSIQNGLKYFMLSLAIGKLVGSLVYYLIPDFTP